MATRIYRVWLRRIESGTFSKAQCQQWAHAVEPLANGYPVGGKATNLTVAEARDLLEALQQRGGVALEPEHTAQGLAWLQRYGVSRVGLPQAAIDGFERFTFQGDAFHERNHYGGGWSVPFWRIHTRDGRTFDYYATAWQTAAGFGWIETTGAAL